MLVQTIIFLSVALIAISVLALILIDKTALNMRNEFLNDDEKSLFKLLIEAFPDMFVFSHVSTLAILEPKKGLKRKEYKRIYNTLSRHFFLFTLFTKDDEMRFVCAVEFVDHDEKKENSQGYKDLQAILKRNSIITLHVSTLELPNKLVLRQQLNEKLNAYGFDLLPELKDILTEQIKRRTEEKGGLNNKANTMASSQSESNGPVINSGIPIFNASIETAPTIEKEGITKTTEFIINKEPEDNPLEEKSLTELQAGMTYEHIKGNLKNDDAVSSEKNIEKEPLKASLNEESKDIYLTVNTNLDDKTFPTLTAEEEMKILNTNSIALADEILQDKLAAEEAKQKAEAKKAKDKILDPVPGLDDDIVSNNNQRSSNKLNNTNDLFYNLN